MPVKKSLWLSKNRAVTWRFAFCFFAALFLAWAPRVIHARPNPSQALFDGLTLRDAGLASAYAGQGCVQCHGAADSATTVTITGPAVLSPGLAGLYTVTAQNASVPDGSHMGFLAAVSPRLPNNSDPSSLTPFGTEPIATTYQNQIFHFDNTADHHLLQSTSGHSASYHFYYTMPATETIGSVETIYAVARLGGTGHLATFNFAANFYVTAVSPLTVTTRL